MKCSKCGNEFEGNYCPNCGAPAQSVPTQQQSSFDHPKTTVHPFGDKIVTCKTCGKQISKTAKRCPYCGARQHQGALTAFSLILVFALIAIFWVISDSFQNGNTASATPQAANVTVNASDISSSKSDGHITKAAYDKIKTGMTYDEVKKIVGSEGKNIFESGDKGTESYQISYMWVGQNGGEATIGFSGKSGLKVLMKSQSGLE